METANRQRVAVALSGGVDSATAAACLLEQGHEVIGLTMRLWEEPGGAAAGSPQRTCCAPEDLQDARRVAQTLDIPFYVLDLTEAFRREVVRDCLESYAAGRTPNPCVRCNQSLKFHHLLARALELEAVCLATGHYAILDRDAAGGMRLCRAADRRKDQSYFLFSTPYDQLGLIRFPLGGIGKEETRRLARRFGLHLAAKRESQDLCFVPDGDLAAFLVRQGVAMPSGPIVDPDGRVLGAHRGLGRYTVGQRKGLGLAAPQPLYVLAIDAAQNRLVVGPEARLYREELEVMAVNWLAPSPPARPMACQARIRYAAEPQPAWVEPLPDGRARVRFAQPQRAITPGQACVFYAAEQVLGGGWICGETVGV